jgi:arylsulfatase
MPDRRPNILWLMTDEQRTDSLGFYGSPWARTPNLDRLARQGTAYRNAVTPAPVCVPARLSMLTGLYPHQTRIWWNRGALIDHPHLTQVFAEAGYRTASFGKQHYCTANPAFQAERNLVLSDAVHYFHYAEKYDHGDYDVVTYPGEKRGWVLGGRYPEAAENTTESRSVDAAMDWLAEHPTDAPFLLRVSFNGPHTPVAPPAPFDTMIDPDAIDLPPEADAPPEGQPPWLRRDLASMAGSSPLSREQVRRMRQAYYGEAAFLDLQFGRLLDWMRPRGLLENTIIAYVSDHGTHLGDYGLVQKQTFYRPVVCVPFLLHYPRAVSQGVMNRTPVETIRLLPTLLQLAGLEKPETCGLTGLGSSLTHGAEPPDECVFSELSIGSFGIRAQDRLVMAWRGDFKLSVCLDPEPCEGQLHDLTSDPLELTNLYDHPQYAHVQADLLRRIQSHVGDALPAGPDERPADPAR